MKTLMIAMTIVLAIFTSVAFAAGTQTAKAGKYTVEFTTQPAPPTVGENHVTITVKDADKPVEGAGVSLHIDMVGMSMPAEVKSTAGTQPGEYLAVANLAMKGEWKITAEVQGMAGMAMDGDGKATFTVTVAEAAEGGTPGAMPMGNMPMGNMPMGNTPMEPAAPVAPAPAEFPWLWVIIAAIIAGIVLVVVITRGTPKKTPDA